MSDTVPAENPPPARRPHEHAVLRTTAEVDTLLGHAWDARRSDPAAAGELCEQALKASRTLAYRWGVARSLYVRSCVHGWRSDLQAALEDAQVALSHFEALDDPANIEDTLTVLGIFYSELGELSEALKYFLKRYSLCAGRGDAGEAEALQNLGYIHDYLGNHAESLTYNLKSWKLCTAHGDLDGETRLLNNIGYCYYRLGQHDEALAHYRKALALGKADLLLHPLLLDNMALSFEKLGDLENALTYQQQSLSRREKEGDKRGLSYSLDSLGSIYQTLGEDDKARACLERGLSLKKTLGDQKGEAETLLLLGTFLLDRSQATEALPLLQRALATAAHIRYQEGVYGAHRALSRAFKSQGCLSEALEHFERYYEVKERVINETSQRTLGSLRVQFETEQAEREREIYRLKNVELARANAELQTLNEQATELLEQLERQAKEDALTGLYNRRYADARLREEFTRARRFGHALSVALLDIDNFKRINDGFSHAVGDEVLRTVARLFEAGLREVDIVARYGGEEFVLLLPETSARGAAKVCDDLRRRVAAHDWDTVAPGLEVTLSIGLSDELRVPTHEKLVALADGKLYEAKHAGKNQVRG